MTQWCHCGRPLHYSHPVLRRAMDEVVAEFGEYTDLTFEGRTWRVQRHYIALHGVKLWELPELGFEEITAP